MSQKGDIVILVPGESAWEVWSGPPSGPFVLEEATETSDAGEIVRSIEDRQGLLAWHKLYERYNPSPHSFMDQKTREHLVNY